MTAYPSGVLIVTVRPFLGSQPANDTCPAAGARTAEPASPPTSIPLCPCSWYSGPPKSKPRSTGPSAGQLQAAAGPGATSASTTSIATAAVVLLVNIAAEPSRQVGCCQNRLQRLLVEPVARNAGEPRDHVRSRASRHAPRNELGDSLHGGALVEANFDLARADHERDLAFHIAREPLSQAPSPSRARPPRNVWSARGKRRPAARAEPPRGSPGHSPAAAATRTRRLRRATGRARPTTPAAHPRLGADSQETGTDLCQIRSRRGPSRPPTAPGARLRAPPPRAQPSPVGPRGR